jgi:hypothetical protein
MKIPASLIFFILFFSSGFAQTNTVDSTVARRITVDRDPRLDILFKKEAEFNLFGTKTAKGFRLLVLSTNDREKAMKTRARLLQQFPDQKVYMAYQAPYIKLKLGNFVVKDDAEKFKDQISRLRIVTSNIYIVPELVEVRPDKNKDKEKEKEE